MKRKRFTEEQIIGILNEAEQAGNIREVCRLNNTTEQTFYRWRTKFGGMDVSEAKRLKELVHRKNKAPILSCLANPRLILPMHASARSSHGWKTRSMPPGGVILDTTTQGSQAAPGLAWMAVLEAR